MTSNLVMELAQATFGPDRPGALAGPFGLFLTIALAVAIFFIIRNMNKHLRVLNARLAKEAAADEGLVTSDAGDADPIGTVAKTD